MAHGSIAKNTVLGNQSRTSDSHTCTGRCSLQTPGVVFSFFQTSNFTRHFGIFNLVTWKAAPVRHIYGGPSNNKQENH